MQTQRGAVMLIAWALTAALIAPPAARAQAPINVYVDGQMMGFDVPPSVVEGRVFVPLRGVFEQLGATVDYDPTTQHVVAIRGPQSVELTIGSRQARVNGLPTLLDVAAFTVSGRTMVPLRFISESLGANVQWVAAQRVVMIGTAAATPPAGPAQPTAPPPSVQGQPGPPPIPVQPSGTPQPSTSPAVDTVLEGRLVAVSTGQNPALVVRSNGEDHTVPVLPETSIFRYDARTNAGGSAALASLRAGDRVTIVLNGQGTARKVTASYELTPGGRIAAVDPARRTVTLANGRSFVILGGAEITVNGQPAGWEALQSGRVVRFLVVQGTNEAYAARVTTDSAQIPPATPAVPRIVSPAEGEQVGNTFTVRGTARPGAVVLVEAQPRVLGQAARAETTADPGGGWRVTFTVTGIPVVGFPYVISAVEVVDGVQSDPVTVQVSVR